MNYKCNDCWIYFGVKRPATHVVLQQLRHVEALGRVMVCEVHFQRRLEKHLRKWALAGYA